MRAIREWSEETCEGSLQDMRVVPSGETWERVNVESGNCLWQKCPEFGKCFYMKARALVQQANLLIVNHHLLFSELALRGRGGGFLPPFAAVVIDEAHQIESVATEHFGVRFSSYMFTHWLRRLYLPEKNKGLFAVLQHGGGA